MKCYISVVCALSVLVALSYAAPMPQNEAQKSTVQRVADGLNDKLNLFRENCPQLFKVVSNVISNVTSTAFRVFGRAILQSGALTGGGGGGGGGGALGGGKVSVVLPTFGPDDDDYEDEDEEETNSIVSSSTTTTTTTAATSTSADTKSSATDDVELNILDVRTNNDNNSTSSVATRSKREIREKRATEDQKAADADQDAAASGGNALNPSDDLANVDDDADRDKRFSPFGLFGGGGHGSGGGSGNFLFDIIRSTADGAARAAGTVYRMIAGTENSGLSLTAATHTAKLVAGSGTTEDVDEKENAPLGPGGVAEIDVSKGGDGYTEGIPGPITRLFVLANRGLANLIQDLILRLAQTSERIVNFKARLITALI